MCTPGRTKEQARKAAISAPRNRLPVAKQQRKMPNGR
jgi:hypothetical protein